VLAAAPTSAPSLGRRLEVAPATSDLYSGSGWCLGRLPTQRTLGPDFRKIL